MCALTVGVRSFSVVPLCDTMFYIYSRLNIKLRFVKEQTAMSVFRFANDGLRSVQLTDAIARSAWNGVHVSLSYRH